MCIDIIKNGVSSNLFYSYIYRERDICQVNYLLLLRVDLIQGDVFADDLQSSNSKENSKSKKMSRNSKNQKGKKNRNTREKNAKYAKRTGKQRTSARKTHKNRSSDRSLERVYFDAAHSSVRRQRSGVLEALLSLAAERLEQLRHRDSCISWSWLDTTTSTSRRCHHLRSNSSCETKKGQAKKIYVGLIKEGDASRGEHHTAT